MLLLTVGLAAFLFLKDWSSRELVKDALGAQLTFAKHRSKQPSLALTASDGTGLKLISVRAQTVIEQPLAFTELYLVFENPQSRVLEGRFEIALPMSASVSRFSMKIGDRWQEGEVVEKQAARRIYEDFLHRKQDPALLEQGPGNTFSARVFPIAAKDRKELIVSYAQELTTDETPLIPLSGLSTLKRLKAEVYVGDASKPQIVEHTDYAPQGDLVLKQSAKAVVLRNADLAVARVQAPDDGGRDALDSVLLLVDTSASGALDFEQRIRKVEMLSSAMAERNEKARLALVAFDQSSETLFQGKALGVDEHVVARLKRRKALGATNLAAALDHARRLAEAGHFRRVVLISDGIATAGATPDDSLVRKASQLRKSGVLRLDALACGGLRNDDLLHKLVTADLPRAGVVIDDGAASKAVLSRLVRRAHRKLELVVPGASFQHPKTLSGVQSGDEILVFAKLAPLAPFRVGVGSKAPVALPERTVVRPLVERAWAKAKIKSLLEGKLDRQKRRRIVALSTKHRVLSPFTGLLVLETQRDYDRYGLARDALGDIMTVERGRLTVLQRRAPNKPQTLAREALEGGTGTRARGEEGTMGRDTNKRFAVRGPKDERFGARIAEETGDASLRLSGIGEGGGGKGEGLGTAFTSGHSATPVRRPAARAGSGQGFGSGRGRLGGSHKTRAPQVRMGAISVSGRLPPESIQRIVRMNFGRFRMCYERGLAQNPNLAGRVVMRFVIERDGSVGTVNDAGSTLANERAIECIRAAFYQLTFPEPEGGIVTVVYPITLSPGTNARTATSSPAPPARARSVPRPQPRVQEPTFEPEWPKAANPYTGRFADVMAALSAGQLGAAKKNVRQWLGQRPGDVMALIALGELGEAENDATLAGRAYGSIIDLFPARADLRRYAGARLEHLKTKKALGLAADSFEKARQDRPDHATSHRQRAYALVKQKRFGEAFKTLKEGLLRENRRARPGVQRVLREDLGLIAAAWMAAEPKEEQQILKALAAAGGTRERGPSLRFVLSWETDANDVDLHIYDERGDHAFYQRRTLRSGGELYADVTNGYGPEEFTVRGTQRAKTYRLQAHYYSRGPMGFGMGKLSIIKHDGKGNLSIEERPFVVMRDQAYVDLGKLTTS